MTSAFHQIAANLVDNGFHPLPVMPGSKVPGQYQAGTWRPMPGWTKYCDHAVASFILDQWEQWPGAGVCVAHGRVIGLDVDTDRDASGLMEAMMLGGPVALAATRFSSEQMKVVEDEFRQSVEDFQTSNGGYEIPGEFVSATGVKAG